VYKNMVQDQTAKNDPSKASADAPSKESVKNLCILQVTPELNGGGVERGTLDIAAAIVAAGGRALVASNGGRMVPELLQKGGELIEMNVKSKNPFVIWRNGRRLAKLIRQEKVDLIHARSRAPAWSALRAAHLADVPFFTTYHGSYNAQNSFKRFYNSVMARSDQVIAVSHFIRDLIIAEHGLGANQIRVVARGSDVSRFNQTSISAEKMAQMASQWDIDSNKRVILLVGRLTRWKGQMILLQSLAELVKDPKHKDLLCLMVGEDQGRKDYSDEMRAFIMEHKLEDHVRMVGHCEDIPTAMAISDMVVCPSIDPEAFGRVPIEAQAMGRPVIASDHGGARETVVLGKTGLLIPPSDTVALAEAIEGILSLDEETLTQVAEAARQHVLEHFTKEKMCADTLQLYQQATYFRKKFEE
jgi:glycosyltransferase involved in cell wall biosynthesis